VGGTRSPRNFQQTNHNKTQNTHKRQQRQTKNNTLSLRILYDDNKPWSQPDFFALDTGDGDGICVFFFAP
jgi:hypothetical protein